jgi:hypothetical protein
MGTRETDHALSLAEQLHKASQVGKTLMEGVDLLRIQHRLQLV